MRHALAGDVYMWGRVTEGEEQQEHKAKQLQGAPIPPWHTPLLLQTSYHLSRTNQFESALIILRRQNFIHRRRPRPPRGRVIQRLCRLLRQAVASKLLLWIITASCSSGSRSRSRAVAGKRRSTALCFPLLQPPHTTPQAPATHSAATNSANSAAPPATRTTIPCQYAASLPRLR